MVGKQPGCKCFLFTICKEFYWLTKLKIYKDGAVGLALFPGPII